MASMLTKIQEGLNNCKEFAYNGLERDEIKALREGVKGTMHTTKLVATALLIITVAVTFFASVVAYAISGGFGLLMGLSSLIIGGVVGFICYDTTIAAEEGYQLAEKAENFNVFNSPSDPKKLIDHCRKLVTKMLGSTHILKHAHDFILNRYWKTLSSFLEIAAKKRNNSSSLI